MMRRPLQKIVAQPIENLEPRILLASAAGLSGARGGGNNGVRTLSRWDSAVKTSTRFASPATQSSPADGTWSGTITNPYTSVFDTFVISGPDGDLSAVATGSDGYDKLFSGSLTGTTLSMESQDQFQHLTAELTSDTSMDVSFSVKSGAYFWTGTLTRQVQLEFEDQPTDTPAGVPVSPVKVDILGTDGMLVDTLDSSVALSLASGDGTLIGTTTVAADAGVATFDDLSLGTSGSYTIKATADGTSTVSDSFDIGPVELQGDFNGGVTTGTVSVGLAPPSGGAFVPLLEVSDGSVSYQGETVEANGLFISLIGENSVPLFTGSATFLPGSTSATDLQITSNQLNIAGEIFQTSGLSLAKKSFTLTGVLTLPSAFGGGEISVDGENGIRFSSTGMHFKSTLEASGPSVIPLGTLGLSLVTPMELSLDDAHNGIRAQGSFSASTWFKGPSISFEFENGKYLEYDPVRGMTMIGTLEADADIELVPKLLTLTQCSLAWTDNSLAVGGKIKIDDSVSVGASMTLLNGEVNSASIKLTNLDVQLPDGFYLDQIGGTVNHISPADTAATTYTGNMGISVGPKIKVGLPKALGGEVTGYIWSAYGEVTVGADDAFSVSGTVSDLGNAASGTGLVVNQATISANILTGAVSYSGSVSFLNQTIEGIIKFSVDPTTGTVKASGTGQLSIPSLTLVGHKFPKQLLTSAELDLQISTVLGNSFIAAWGSAKVSNSSTPALYGIELNLGTGKTTYIDSKNPPPAVT
jgi:hypothetical protein